MNDLGLHLLLFSIVGVAIVTLSAFFSEVEDDRALKTIPRRLLFFFVGCTLISVVLIVFEHTVASVH